MNILKSILCVTISMVLLLACESPVSNISREKLPQTEPKLVVNSVISPQLPFITVLVTESVPLFSNSNASENRIDDANVRISDGKNEMTIPYDADNRLYTLAQSKFPILPSKTYTLTVSHGARTVTGECTVPEKAPVIKSYEFDTLLIPNDVYPDSAVTLKVSWQDIASDTNYYKVHAGLDVERSIAVDEKTDDFKEKRILLRHNFYWNWQQGRNEYMSDNRLNGALLTSAPGKADLPRVVQKIYGSGKKVVVYPRTQIKLASIEVFNLDVNYYKYQRSLEIRGNSDSPFAEPASIYTNIKGGFGCFAAYNAAQVKIAFSK